MPEPVRVLTPDADHNEVNAPVGLSGKIISSHGVASVREHGRLLARLDEIPPKNQAVVFAAARTSFTTHRQTADQLTLDSLYVLCSTGGGKAIVAFTNTNDTRYQQRAIDWYQTAYALKPYPALKNRISRLQKTLMSAHGPPERPTKPQLTATPARVKQPRKPAKKTSATFVPDSEVNP